MKRILPFLIPFVAVTVAGVLVLAVSRSDLFAPACETWEPFALAELDVTDGCVEVEVMAHYTAVVEQTTEGSLLREPEHHWLYGVFEPYDTQGRAIRVLARSPWKPEDLVSYELMRVRGRVAPVTPDKVPFKTETILGETSEYFFSDDMLLLEVHEIAAVEE